jgi:hypothetical protein
MTVGRIQRSIEEVFDCNWIGWIWKGTIEREGEV